MQNNIETHCFIRDLKDDEELSYQFDRLKHHYSRYEDEDVLECVMKICTDWDVTFQFAHSKVESYDFVHLLDNDGIVIYSAKRVAL